MQNAHAAPWLSHCQRCACLVLGELELNKKKHPAYWVVQCPLLMEVWDRLYLDRAAGVISIYVSLSNICVSFNRDCVCAHYMVLLH